MLNKLVCVFLCFSLVSCTSTKDEEASLISSSSREIDEGLVLYNATLEQSNESGQTLWKLSTEKTFYSQDRQTANLKKVTGNFFNNSQLVLQVSADKGEIKQDGQEIFLEDNILAVDPRNQAELKGNQLEWRPDENIVVLRNNLTGNHAKLTFSAKEGIYQIDKQNLQLKGNIIATTKKPSLQMKTEHLYWNIAQDKVIGNKPLKMTLFEGKTVTDQLNTNRVEVDLKTHLATLKDNIEYKSLKPPLQAATSILYWQYKDRIIQGNNPIKLIQIKDNMTLTGNQGKVNLRENIAYLHQGVYGEAAENEVKIYANDLVWNMKTEVLEATGDVFYKQINPDFNLRGVKAVGKLKDKSVVVTGDYENKVITEIYPQEKSE